MDPGVALAGLRQFVPWETLAWAHSSKANPSPDEVLHAVNAPERLFARWLDSDDHREPFSCARKNGEVSLNPAEAESVGLGGMGFVTIVALGTTGPGPRWWWLALARKENGFSPDERAIATMALRQWEASFHQPPTPMVGRVLLDRQFRLMHADPNTRVLFIRSPGVLDHLVQTMSVLVPQRWGEVGVGEPLDFVLTLEGGPWWVRFHREPLAGSSEPGRWHLELYHLAEGELPVVGSIEDARIARAVGYIHQHYHRTPSLGEIADAVGVSPYHFHRLFTRTVGVSPKSYLQCKQIQVARWLLRATRKPIGAIAVDTGFSSHGHFTSTFRRMVGENPSDFREKA
ncbi:MAG: AraC family transcriptional regulator [Planctomycetes bacterium]|nr:AraC family transcriptional regulator [Planctomycetota bacterium]